MKALLLAAVLGFAVFTISGVALADDGDVALVDDADRVVGEPFAVRFEVRTSDAVTVGVDFASESWGPAEVLSELSHDVDLDGVGALHTFEVLLSSFQLGDVVFAPSVIVSDSGVDEVRVLATETVFVASTLAADEPLTLSPLAAPGSVGGRQSVFLLPGIVAGVVAATVVLGVLVIVLVRRIGRSWSLSGPDEPAADDDEQREPLAVVASLLDDDPMGAYRIIGQAVRRALADAYALPVASMTTDELQGRLEPEGVDSWVVRMAADLLSQCDAVVYAGYRPALERRRGDLAVAGEILRVAD